MVVTYRGARRMSEQLPQTRCQAVQWPGVESAACLLASCPSTPLLSLLNIRPMKGSTPLLSKGI